MLLINLDTIFVGVVVTSVGALLTGLGWLIGSQVKTNKTLRESVTSLVVDLKLFINEQREKEKLTNLSCQQKRMQIQYQIKELDHKCRTLEMHKVGDALYKEHLAGLREDIRSLNKDLAEVDKSLNTMKVLVKEKLGS